MPTTPLLTRFIINKSTGHVNHSEGNFTFSAFCKSFSSTQRTESAAPEQRNSKTTGTEYGAKRIPANRVAVTPSAHGKARCGKQSESNQALRQAALSPSP